MLKKIPGELIPSLLGGPEGVAERKRQGLVLRPRDSPGLGRKGTECHVSSVGWGQNHSEKTLSFFSNLQIAAYSCWAKELREKNPQFSPVFIEKRLG